MIESSFNANMLNSFLAISDKVTGTMFRFVTLLESLAHRRFKTYRRIRPDDQLGELALFWKMR